MITDLIAAVLAELLLFDLSGQFMWLIIIAFVGYLFRLTLCGPGDAWVQSAASTLLSMGVLGTFAGVVVGLSGFKSARLEDGLGEALGGLSAAFYSSLLAMALSLVFKLVQVHALQRLRERDDPDASDDVAERLLIETGNGVKQLRQLNVNAREHAEYLIHITNAVADHSDANSLPGQLALQRQQSERELATLVAELQQLREQGEAALELLEALRLQQLAQVEQADDGERELSRQFDGLQQVLMTLPNRRDFRSLGSIIADGLEPGASARQGMRL